MLLALYPGCQSAHVVALRLTTRLLLPGALGFLPYRGDLCAKFLVITLHDIFYPQITPIYADYFGGIQRYSVIFRVTLRFLYGL